MKCIVTTQATSRACHFTSHALAMSVVDSLNNAEFQRPSRGIWPIEHSFDTALFLYPHTMTPHFDDEMVKQSMHEHLSAFHSALLCKNPAEKVNSFLSSFSAFSQTIRKHHDKLQNDTLVAVGGFFSAINSLSTTILQLERNLEKLQQEATEELSQLTLNDEKPERATGQSFSPFLPMSFYAHLTFRAHSLPCVCKAVDAVASAEPSQPLPIQGDEEKDIQPNKLPTEGYRCLVFRYAETYWME